MNEYLATFSIIGAFIIGGITSVVAAGLHMPPAVSCPAAIVTSTHEKIDCSKEEDFGYANGAIMPTRILSENEWFKEKGFPSYDPKMTCEIVVAGLYNQFINKASQ